eukprot:2880595-Rhodomonas_salina.2
MLLLLSSYSMLLSLSSYAISPILLPCYCQRCWSSPLPSCPSLRYSDTALSLQLLPYHLPPPYAISGTDLAYAATRQSGHDYYHLCCGWVSHSFSPGTSLRAPCAMSGTDVAYGALSAYTRSARCSVPWYTMSGTHVACVCIYLGASYTMSGTYMACAPTRGS